jgi:DNA polymerase elongation subunit (family B)
MEMKREKICESGFWTAKKRYATLVWDEKGVRFSEPELMATGLEIVRTSTPKVVKAYLRELLTIILQEPSKISDYIKEVRKKFYAEPVEAISTPTSANNLMKYDNGNGTVAPKCPAHVRGAILFNKFFGTAMTSIKEGEKIKYVYLKMPNPIQSDVVSFIRKFPKKLLPYVDYSLQFDKKFGDVAASLCKTLNVESKKECVSLDDLF